MACEWKRDMSPPGADTLFPQKLWEVPVFSRQSWNYQVTPEKTGTLESCLGSHQPLWLKHRNVATVTEPSLSGLIRQMISRCNNIAEDAPKVSLAICSSIRISQNSTSQSIFLVSLISQNAQRTNFRITECEKHRSDTALLKLHGTDEHIKIMRFLHKDINITGRWGKASLRKWHRTKLWKIRRLGAILHSSKLFDICPFPNTVYTSGFQPS